MSEQQPFEVDAVPTVTFDKTGRPVMVLSLPQHDGLFLRMHLDRPSIEALVAAMASHPDWMRYVVIPSREPSHHIKLYDNDGKIGWEIGCDDALAHKGLTPAAKILKQVFPEVLRLVDEANNAKEVKG